MDLLAVSTAVTVAYVVLIFALIVGPPTVTALKGQWALFAAGWLTIGVVWLIAAVRLARPGSWWARHLYGPEKLARAEARYPARPDEERTEIGPIGD